jgi:hypothetical protein
MVINGQPNILHPTTVIKEELLIPIEDCSGISLYDSMPKESNIKNMQEMSTSNSTYSSHPMSVDGTSTSNKKYKTSSGNNIIINNTDTPTVFPTYNRKKYTADMAKKLN